MDQIGEVVSSRGQVQAVHGDVSRALSVGSPVYEGEEIVTGPKGGVEIRFVDESILAQGPSSHMTLDEYVYDPDQASASNMLYNAATGTFRMVTGKIAELNPEGVEVKTPLATIGIRGTGVDLQLRPDGSEKYGVFQYDNLDLVVSSPQGTRFITQAGVMLDMAANGALGLPRPYSPQETQFFKAAAPITSLGDPADGGDQDNGDQDDGGRNGDDGQDNGDDADGGDQNGDDTGDDQGEGGEPEPAVEVNETVEEAFSFLSALPGPVVPAGLGPLGPFLPQNQPPVVVINDPDDDNPPEDDTPPPDDTIVGGTSYGTSGPDTIIGTAGDDCLLGLDGNDSILGLDGNDTLEGCQDNDTLNGGAGDDYLYGSKGDDLLISTGGGDRLYGGDDNDRFITGNMTGNGVVNGGSGTDTLNVSGNLDLTQAMDIYSIEALDYQSASSRISVKGSEVGSWKLYGHSLADLAFTAVGGTYNGNSTYLSSLTFDNWNGRVIFQDNGYSDRVYGSSRADSMTGGTGNDTLIGNDGSDTLLGGIGDDCLQGGLDNDSLLGEDGNDTLKGDLGNDTLTGGAGNDWLDPGSGTDQVDGGTGLDILSLAAESTGLTATMTQGSSSIHHGSIGVTYTGIEGFQGTSGNDELTGGAGHDILYGYHGVDTLHGGGGDDSLFGGIGSSYYNDWLHGDGGNDWLDGGYSNDTLTGGTENDTLLGGSGNDSLNGDEGGDCLLGDSGTDVLLGGDGNDAMYGGNDADSLFGEAGQDCLFGEYGDDSLYGGTEGDTLDGGYGADSLFGDTGSDSIFGGYGTYNDTLSGDTGDDTLDGGYGDDSLSGGADNDTLIGGYGNDTLSGGDGLDSIVGGDGFDLVDYSYLGTTRPVIIDLNLGSIIPQAGVDVDAFSGIEGAIGTDYHDTNTGDDSMLGDAAANYFMGMAGDDTLDGGLGDDTLDGGAGNDCLIGGVGNDWINPGDSAGTNEVAGGADTDIISLAYSNAATNLLFTVGSGTLVHGGVTTNYTGIEGLAGTVAGDTLLVAAGSGALVYGEAGNDSLLGNVMDDCLYGGADHDKIVGGDGNDSLYGDDGNDSLVGGVGSDVLDGGDGNDTLLGSDGNDTLYGGDGDDCLIGGAGVNYLDGGYGDDTLMGDPGSVDTLASGSYYYDHDVYRFDDFHASSPADWVTDFDNYYDEIHVDLDAPFFTTAVPGGNLYFGSDTTASNTAWFILKPYTFSTTTTYTTQTHSYSTVTHSTIYSQHFYFTDPAPATYAYGGHTWNLTRSQGTNSTYYMGWYTRLGTYQTYNTIGTNTHTYSTYNVTWSGLARTTVNHDASTALPYLWSPASLAAALADTHDTTGVAFVLTTSGALQMRFIKSDATTQTYTICTIDEEDNVDASDIILV